MKTSIYRMVATLIWLSAVVFFFTFMVIPLLESARDVFIQIGVLLFASSLVGSGTYTMIAFTKKLKD